MYIRSNMAAVLTSTLLVAAVVGTAQAADTDTNTNTTTDNQLHGEVTPYLWAAGIDSHVTVRGQKAKINVGFNDLLKKTDAAASVLGVLQYGQIVGWGQVDYLGLSDKASGANISGKLTIDTTIVTLAAGYMFYGSKGRTYSVLGGVRNMYMDNKLKLDSIGNYSKSNNITDAVVVFRPSIPLYSHLRFNPTMSIGAGDSKLTYELWPQLQYQFTKNLAARVGYRRLFYNVKTGNGNKFDGSLHGFMLGVGYVF